RAFDWPNHGGIGPAAKGAWSRDACLSQNRGRCGGSSRLRVAFRRHFIESRLCESRHVRQLLAAWNGIQRSDQIFGVGMKLASHKEYDSRKRLITLICLVAIGAAHLLIFGGGYLASRSAEGAEGPRHARAGANGLGTWSSQ